MRLARAAIVGIVAVGGVIGVSSGSGAAAATAVTLKPTADTYIDSSEPEQNFGTAAELVTDGSPRRRAYLMFTVPSNSSTVSSATLRIYANSADATGYDLYRVSNTSWRETTLDYRNRPYMGTKIGSSGPFDAGSWTEVDVTDYVQSAGSYTMAMVTRDSKMDTYASRESSGRDPQLVIEYDSTQTSGPTTPATKPPTPTDSAPVLPAPDESDPQSVFGLVENVGFSGSGDISDDSAIWVDQETPSRSVVIADNKAESGGGVGVFDMKGKLIQFQTAGMIGNVDLRDGFSLDDEPEVLVGGNNRTNDTLSLWTLDTTDRRLTPVNVRNIDTVAPNYGFCMYHSKVSGKFYAFVTPSQAGAIQQFELVDNGSGQVDAKLVRTLQISSITESCVADDDLGKLYVGQENVGIWKYGAEPGAGSSRTAVDSVGGGRLVADIEGMSIAYGPNESGYLFVSSQGDSTIAVYDRAGRNAFVKQFEVVGKGTVDAVTGTDGLDVTSLNAGPGFEQGMLVVHDEDNSGDNSSNLKYVPLNQIVKMTPP